MIGSRPVIAGVTVPSGVFITPDQAFVTGSAQLFANYSSELALSNIGATSFTADGGSQLAALLTGYYDYLGGGANYTYAGNAVATTDLVDAILSAHVTANTQNCTIDVSEGTMAVPTSGTAQPEIYTVDFNGTPVADPLASGSSFNCTVFNKIAGSSGFIYKIAFSATANVADSFAGTDTSGPLLVLVIGIQDSPTAEQMSTAALSLIAPHFTGGMTGNDNGDGTFTVTDASGGQLPYTYSQSVGGNGIVTTQNQAGSSASSPQGILEGNGNTVITN